jgi:hypothetical protein
MALPQSTSPELPQKTCRGCDRTYYPWQHVGRSRGVLGPLGESVARMPAIGL